MITNYDKTNYDKTPERYRNDINKTTALSKDHI